ncbi:MAG: ArnT family glycosyltransferase [Anaerolineales bacterium]
MRVIRAFSHEAVAAAGIAALAAVLRLWKIGAAPRALQYDEALNGLVVLDLLRGDLPPLIVQPGGRESLIFYLQAVSVSLLGRTPGALRLPTALASIALAVGVYLAARELFGRRAGLLAGFLCATTLWPAYLGRLGTRPVLLPSVLAFALFAAVRAWNGSRRWWALAGVLFGLAHYTYSPNVFILPAFGVTVAYIAVWRRDVLRRRWKEMSLAAGVAVGVALPILLFRFTQGDAVARAAEVAVFYAGQSVPDFLRTVFSQTYLVLRMFLLKGDLNPRHNIPGRPVFDILMGLPFLVGLYVSWMRRYRRRALFCLGWMTVFLLPSFLSKDAPHFLRASGILPVLFVWPALGLAWSWKQIAVRYGHAIASALVGGLLLLSIARTTKDYLIDDYLDAPNVLAAFGGKDAALALQINTILQIGWEGDNLTAHPLPSYVDRVVLIDRELWQADLYAKYLVPIVPDQESYFRLLPDRGPLPYTQAWVLLPAGRLSGFVSDAPAAVELTTLPEEAYATSHGSSIFVIVEWSPRE